jgi:hypothetical protein
MLLSQLSRPLSHDKLSQYVTCRRKLEILPSLKFNLDFKCLGCKNQLKRLLMLKDEDSFIKVVDLMSLFLAMKQSFSI